MTMKVGFIGVGNLGVHLAANLLRAGFQVTVHDLRRDAAAGLLNAGAAWASSPKQVAQAADSVFTCLPSPAAVTTVVSHDGRTLLILTSGFNVISDASGTANASSNEFVFVFDIVEQTPKQVQVLQVPNSDSGIVFSPDDSHIYVAGGVDDSLHTFSLSNGVWGEDGAAISLGHKAGLGIVVKPSAAGLDVTADGKKVTGASVLILDRRNDSFQAEGNYKVEILGDTLRKQNPPAPARPKPAD